MRDRVAGARRRGSAILRNFPVVGHLRFLLERFGPELRQYIVTCNDEERPFSRDQRRWVYALVEAGEQLLRLRHRQRHRARAGLPDHQAPHLRRPGRTRRRTPARRSSLPSAKVLGGPRGRAARVPAGVGGQHLRDELRLAVAATRSRRSTGAPRWPAACRTPARAALSPYHRQRRRPRLPDRDGVLRLPRRARRASTWRGSRTWSPSAPVRAIEIKLSQGAKPGLGGMLPGAKVTPGDRRDPRHPAGRGLRVAQPAHGLPRRRLDARLRRAGRRRDRAAGRASSRPSATWSFWDELVAADGRPAARRRLRQHRRRRGRHRRGAADLRRLRRLPVPGRLRRRSTRSSPTAGLTDDVDVHRRRQARHPRERRRRLRARRRHGQRRPRGDAGDRLHPGAEVPHRPLPDRRRDPEPVASRGLDPDAQVACGSPTTSRRCAATCSRSPRRWASCTPA